MNKKHYLYVSILARELSFSRASELLGISQPTLSQCIKKIEQAHGVDLFVRNGSEVSLTEAGKSFLKYSEELLSLEKRMEDELQAIADYRSSSLRIALSPSKCYTLMPSIAERFRKKYPGIKIHIEEKLAGELLKGIDGEVFDLGVTPMPQSTAGYRTDVIMGEEIVLAVPRSLACFEKIKREAKPLAGREYPALPFSSLGGQPFVVMQDWQIMQKQLVDLCSISGVSIIPVVECTNNLTMIMMAERGIGVCLIPGTMVPFSKRLQNANLEYFSIAESIPQREIVCISKKGKSLSEPLKYLIKLMKERGNQQWG